MKIWIDDTNIPTSEKKDRVQISAASGFPFLDTNTSWSPKGGLQFGISGKKGQQPKYIGKCSTNTPGTLQMIPSEVRNCLSKLTLRKPNFHCKSVYSVYLNHTKTWSSPRNPLFLHALSFECTSKLCIDFLNQFSVYFYI